MAVGVRGSILTYSRNLTFRCSAWRRHIVCGGEWKWVDIDVKWAPIYRWIWTKFIFFTFFYIFLSSNDKKRLLLNFNSWLTWCWVSCDCAPWTNQNAQVNRGWQSGTDCTSSSADVTDRLGWSVPLEAVRAATLTVVYLCNKFEMWCISNLNLNSIYF
jgi:hypothetical protein